MMCQVRGVSWGVSQEQGNSEGQVSGYSCSSSFPGRNGRKLLGWGNESGEVGELWE